MNDNPLISVVIAVLNRAITIEQAITSVTNQTFQGIELVVIDGGSTDGSVDIIKKYSTEIAYWISEPDKGIYNAWNKALKKVKGEWVIFLGADDYFWNERVLADVVGELLRLDHTVDVLYGLVNIVNNDGLVLCTVGEEWEKAKKELVYRTSIPHQATFHRRQLFSKHLGFDENLQIAGDYDFFLRALKDSNVRFCGNMIVTAMRYGGISSTFETARIRINEDYYIKKKLGISIINIYWLRRLIITYLRESMNYFLGVNNTRKIEIGARKLIKKQTFWDHI